jgi:ATP-dependent protease ClpP protease subunit
MTPRAWFRFENSATDSSNVDIHIIDFIGGWEDDWIARNWGYEMGVTARSFVEQLAQLGDDVKTIRLHLNSLGGDVQGGINIANALRDQHSKGRTVETYVDGIAASIASVIAMAGSRVVMADNALMMIHDPWAGVTGNARDLRKAADVLDTMRDQQIITTYQWHSTKSADELTAMMEAETWLSADEAIEAGLATEKTQGLRAAASISPVNLDRLRVPAKYRDRVSALLKPSNTPIPADAVDVLRICREAECLDLAEALVVEKLPLDQVRTRVSAEKDRRAAAASREQEIRAICAVEHQDDLADGYVRGQMSPADVRAHLVSIAAKLDGAEIDAALGPKDSGGTSWKNVFSRIKGRKAK